MFKELGNMASMLRQAKDMGSRMQDVAAQLKHKRVTGTAGGGMIEIEANGHGEVLRVKIDRAIGDDLDMIEDLLPAAMNQVSAKAKELHMEMMQSVTGDLDLPDLGDALSSLTGGGE